MAPAVPTVSPSAVIKRSGELVPFDGEKIRNAFDCTEDDPWLTGCWCSGPDDVVRYSPKR